MSPEILSLTIRKGVSDDDEGTVRISKRRRGRHNSRRESRSHPGPNLFETDRGLPDFWSLGNKTGIPSSLEITQTWTETETQIERKIRMKIVMIAGILLLAFAAPASFSQCIPSSVEID